MRIQFEISTIRLENGRTEDETICQLDLIVDRPTLHNQDVENIKNLINEMLDKLKK